MKHSCEESALENANSKIELKELNGLIEELKTVYTETMEENEQVKK